MPTLGLPNMQGVYDATNGVPHISLATAQPFTVRDNSTPIGNVLVCEDDAGDNFFDVGPLSMTFGTVAQRLLDVSNVIAGYGGVDFYPDAFTRTTDVANNAAFRWLSTLTSTVPGGGGIGNENAPNFVSWAGNVILTEQGNLFNTQSLFSQSTTVTCQGANTGPIYTMINQPLFTVGSSGGARTGSQQNAVRSQVRIGPHTAGSFTLASYEPFFATAIFSAAGGFQSAITTINYLACKDQSTAAGGGAPTGVATFNAIDFVNFAYASTIRGINSAMSNGTFIRHIGTAPAEFGGLLSLGAGATVDWSISRAAADRADIASGDSLRLVDGSMEFRSSAAFITAGADTDLHIEATRIGFNVLTGAIGTWMTLSAPARSIGAASDAANCLNTVGGSITFTGAVTNFAQWIVNAPTSSGTAPTHAANMIIQTSVGHGVNRYGLRITSNPGTGGGGVGHPLYVVSGVSSFNDIEVRAGITRFHPLNGTNWRQGVTAPTEVSIGTTPAVPALLFDAVAELASTSENMPNDWNETTDPVLVLKWSLVAAETNGDVASWSLDYTVSNENTTGAGPDRTSTNQLETTTVTTGNGLAINDVYTTEFTLDRGDANNPIAAGDSLHLEIHLTNLTGVAAVHLLDAYLRYTSDR